MRKEMWTVAGIAGLSLLLCGSGELLAQADTTTGATGTTDRDATDTRVPGTEPGDVRVGTPGSPVTPSPGTRATGTPGGTATGTGTAVTGAGQAAGETAGSMAELRQSVLQLQAELARVRQELAQVRATLADVTATMGVGGAGQAAGVGGSGQAGGTAAAGQPNTTAGQGTVVGEPPLRAGTALETGAIPGTTGPGEAVVNAIYTGTVRSVSRGRLELLDENGQPFTMELGEKTRVLRNGQTIPVQQLEQGTRVRVTVDLTSPRNQVMEITTLPAR